MDDAGVLDNLYTVERTHPIIYILITNKYATYREIRDEYTIWEVIDMYEMCMCNIANKSEILNERS